MIQKIFKVNDKIIFLPNPRTIGWCMHSLAHDKLFPGVEVMVRKVKSAAGEESVYPLSRWPAADFRSVKDLTPCPYLTGETVRLNYQVDATFRADGVAVTWKNVHIDEGTFYVEWCEEELRKEGLGFDKIYEIERIEDSRILYLKGVNLGFYWKFFRPVTDEELKTAKDGYITTPRKVE